MPDIWIDSNATGLNDGTSWTNAYADASTAIAGTLTTDNEVWFAHNHLKQYGANTTLLFPDGVKLFSVNSGTDAYQAGAIEESFGGVYDLIVDHPNEGTFFSSGITFKSRDNFQIQGTNASRTIKDCTLALTGAVTSDIITVVEDGSVLNLDAVDLVFGANDQAINFVGGAKQTFNNITVNAISTDLLRVTGNGGACFNITNSDFSLMTGGSLLKQLTVTSDVVKLKVSRCKIPASAFSIYDGTIAYQGQTIDTWSIDNGDGYHYFEYHRYEGIVLESTTIKRTGGATYDGSTGFSVEFQTNANVVTYTNPLKIKLGDYELDLTSENTLTFHLAMQDTATITASTITNDKYWIELVQNSDAASSKALGITIDTKPADVLTTPSALANVATTWTGRTLTYEDEFQIPVTTTVVTGLTTGQVTAYLCVAEHVSTREIYACPSPVVT